MNRLVFLFMMVLMAGPAGDDLKGQDQAAINTDTLVVVWTSGDIEVAEKMVYMYVYNAKRAGWFDEVIFIVWGPSAKLLTENTDLQAEIRKMKDAGIILEACIACARMYNVEEDLRKLGIDVKGMGAPLSDYLKKGYKVMSF